MKSKLIFKFLLRCKFNSFGSVTKTIMVEQTNTQEVKDDKVPAALRDAVYIESVEVKGGEEVRGYEFNNGLDYEAVFKPYRHTDF